MNDLIERSKAVEAIYWEVMEMSNREMAESVLSDVPTVDAVEVVRCKDCRWLENDGYHTRCRIMGLSVEAEDYCSRGERRER